MVFIKVISYGVAALIIVEVSIWSVVANIIFTARSVKCTPKFNNILQNMSKCND